MNSSEGENIITSHEDSGKLETENKFVCRSVNQANNNIFKSRNRIIKND